jgi:trafficking protein particle complex subunit 9
MPVDSFSPFAPARVRALVLPLGRIKRSSFAASHALLACGSEVYLADLCSNERATKCTSCPGAL